MSAESLYLKHLDAIERIAAFVGRRGHLNPEETSEFIQVVRVRLFEDDYAILRKFEGRSSFSTYLTTVILRLRHQWRIAQWGRWRPSAEACRMGEKAVLLERLLWRDGFTFHEAVQILTTREGGEYTVSELESLYVRLPERNPRPTMVSDELLPEMAVVEEDGFDRVEARESEAAARMAAGSIDGTLAALPPEDRLILQLRFWNNRTVADIARMLHMDQKKLYKRLDKLLAGLRVALETAGVKQSDAAKFLGRGDREIRLEILTGQENPHFRPSNSTNGG
ncbi:MAG: sigma-70 family RNA polymerase sigma factor [Acidobacteriota bacterium]